VATGRCVSEKKRRKAKAKNDEKHDAGRAESRIGLHALHDNDEALGLSFIVKMAKSPSKVVVDGDPRFVGYARLQLDRGVDLPMHQDSATSLKPLLYEAVCGREMRQQIFVVDIVDLHNHVLEGAEQVLIEWCPQDRQDVRNVGLLEGFAPSQSEHATQYWLDSVR
jgi:hypothetical protein